MKTLGSITSYSATNVKNLLNGAKCGDVLQFNTTKQHSMIIYSVDSSGVTVYDCNWDNNCGIRKAHVGFGTWSGRNSSKLTLLRSDNYPTDTIVHTVNSSYGKNFTSYPKAKITAGNIYDANHNQISSTAWIGTSDKCTIHEVYTDGCCKVSYPLDSGGTKTVYSKISLFNVHTVNSSYDKNFTAYPKAKITAGNIYDANHNQISSTAWIGTSDKCTIHEVYTDGCCKVSYPLDSGGTKTVYSKISLFNVHTHSYKENYESAHPHKKYMKCSCGDWYYTGIDAATYDSGKITTAATCKSTGVKTYTCTVCKATKTETIAKNPSNHVGGTAVKNAKAATCTAKGYTGDTYCLGCGVITAKGTEISAKGHGDSNNDGKCDTCGVAFSEPEKPDTPNTPDAPSGNCNHICHKKGIAHFFYLIARLFWKIFNTNKYCSCGTPHY